jgi:hypothetical protein
MTEKKEKTELEDLESELKVWEIKLKIAKAKFDYQQLKRAMNDPGPEERRSLPVESF